MESTEQTGDGDKIKGPEFLFAPAEEAVKEAKAFMDEHNLPGVVLVVITGFYPGFKPQGSNPWFERAAGLVGLYMDYPAVNVNNQRIEFYAILSRTPDLSPAEVKTVIEGSPADYPFSRFMREV